MKKFKSFPKPTAAAKKSKPKGKKTFAQLTSRDVAAAVGTAPKKRAKIAAAPKPQKKASVPKQGSTKKPKFKPIDEGLGTVFITLSVDELRQRGNSLAEALQKREEEVEAQASTRSAMKARLDEFDQQIHRLSITITSKREERKAPGLFDKLDAHKDKPLAKDTMAKVLDDADDPEKGYPKCERKGCGHKFSEHEKVTVAGATPGQTICKRNGTTLACKCVAYVAEPKAETVETKVAREEKRDAEGLKAGRAENAPPDVVTGVVTQ